MYNVGKEKIMNKSGFTLVEVLVVVVIVAILSSIALPKYTRSIERARATEAMALVKNLDDAVYAYAADHEGDTNPCPQRFSQLAITLPVANDKVGTLNMKNFTYQLGGATNVTIPGTSCKGTLATRYQGNGYDYYIWLHYSTSDKFSLFCASAADGQKSIELCESLGIYAGNGVKPK